MYLAPRRAENRPYTAGARRAAANGLPDHCLVVSRADLARVGITGDAVTAQLRAGRWQQYGRAIVRHNGPPVRTERWQVARINCGPRALFTSFTAAEMSGLRGWEREEAHVLVPVGTRKPRLPDVVLHRSRGWMSSPPMAGDRHALPAAVVIAASSFRTLRPAVGILAATVQQRLVSCDDLLSAVIAATRTRHRAALLAALADIAQGADALSEIDFARLCRAHELPEPRRQAVRREPGGQRRYLDAEWRLADGRRVAAEVDGALHLDVRRWYDDQLRQNEIVLGGTLVLRFPSWQVRSQPAAVAAQLRRALGLTSGDVDREAATGL